MSAPAFAWAFEMGVKLGLTSAQLLLLAYMADQANCVGSFFTGQPRLVKYTRLSERTVRQLIPQLEALGLIRVTSTPGKPTQYHILRQPTGVDINATPAAAAAPAKGAAAANGTGVTPAATAPQPRQPLPPHPGKIRPQPRQFASPTPAATAPDPYLPKKSTLERARERAQGKEDFQDREEEASKQDAASPSVPAATLGSDTFNAYLEAPTPTRALPAEIEQEVVRADVPEPDAPIGPQATRAFVHSLARNFQNNYPPRAPRFSRAEQIDLCRDKPRIKPLHLPEAVLRLARMQLAERAAAP